MVVRAPAKLNLCLYLGPSRSDGLHEIRSLFCPLALSDRIVVTTADEDADEVVCDGVDGPNLAAAATPPTSARVPTPRRSPDSDSAATTSSSASVPRCSY